MDRSAEIGIDLRKLESSLFMNIRAFLAKVLYRYVNSCEK